MENEFAFARELRAQLAVAPRLTLAVAESVTCGRLQAAIGAIPGASEVFLGGITAYSVAQKVRHLGVSAEEAASCDAVSAAVAAQMAIGAGRMFGSDLAAATTGYAGPNPARGYAAPAAFWAIAQRGRDGELRIVRESFLERPGLARVAMQEEVVRDVLAALLAHVRAIRAEHG